jgi:hypothetical protein
VYVLNGKQSSSSFNDHAAAVRFQDLANRTSPAKALEVWAATTPSADVFTVASWCTHHVDHLTGVNEATGVRYRRYVANDIASSTIGPLPLTALTNQDVAKWLNGPPELPRPRQTNTGFWLAHSTRQCEPGTSIPIRVVGTDCVVTSPPRWCS